MHIGSDIKHASLLSIVVHHPTISNTHAIPWNHPTSSSCLRLHRMFSISCLPSSAKSSQHF